MSEKTQSIACASKTSKSLRIPVHRMPFLICIYKPTKADQKRPYPVRVSKIRVRRVKYPVERHRKKRHDLAVPHS